MLPQVPGFYRVTAENDTYHPGSDVHGQGKAIDFTLRDPSRSSEAADNLRRQLSKAGIRARVIDEYNNPSPRATGGHIHVSLP
jgi:hypothetical protein